MNFIDKLSDDLRNCGLFPDMIMEIVNKTTLAQPEAAKRFHEDPSDYPEIFYQTIWATCRIVALEYIDTHCPKAWFRALFDDKDPIHAEYTNRKNQ